MRDSWFYYSKAILDRIMLQPARPIIVLYTHVRDLLGGDLRSDVRSIALPVKFPQWGDTTYYQSSAYPYGTSQFRVAAKLAGLDRCLRNIYGKN
jgi:hypothetical protein